MIPNDQMRTNGRRDSHARPRRRWRSLTSSAPPAGRGVIAARLQKDGWRWIVDAHKGDGKRYVVHSDELLTAFLELEAILLPSRILASNHVPNR